ncbi:PhzF family phenazine biosynthesis protein [Pseudophaeobacter sp. EL27]|uniref:PhzF family phenazine biosynthesis protein n=1 Tax=Pseudophaeobacter sp. EL27 TaxID=2107580 RepID=UPI0013C533CB|nr:PhzF family phenazine biosynthesis protein [Pseudophaeobacter sp. EL27]
MKYGVVDVFSDKAFMGNPVAVVFPDREMSVDEMLAVTAWFNLSETTFVTNYDPEAASYDVRIFTLGQELPFAGHPTLGTAAAVRKNFAPEAKNLTQNCGAGAVSLRFDAQAGTVHLIAPGVSLQPLKAEDQEEIAQVFGDDVPVQASARVDAGPIWVTLITDSPETVMATQPDLTLLNEYSQKHGATGIQLAAGNPTGDIWKVRTFAPAVGVPEDPVCGSGNIAVAGLRRSAGLGTSDYVAKQGQEVGRDGEIVVRYIEQDKIEVGGATRITASGELLV